MSPDYAKVDLLIRYSLLLAGEADDYRDRQLGPIHLIKYVYLADVFFADASGGKSFTGIDWIFYKFGPWSQQVHERIMPALTGIMASRETFKSDYEEANDWVRWSISNDELLDRLNREMPLSIAGPLKKAVRKFGKDTPTLLEFVYSTTPMLRAAPNETLNMAPRHPEWKFTQQSAFVPALDSLSNKRKEKFLAGIKDIRSKVADSSKCKRLVNPATIQRFDEVYETGINWLSRLAGDEIAPFSATAKFDESAWKSTARNADEFSG